MRFQVPQFIDVEDKIFGPLSFRQFIYLAGGAGGAFIVYQILPLFIAIPIMILIGGLGGALAFYKINNRSFIVMLQAGLKFLMEHKLYLWHQDPESKNKKRKNDEENKETEQQILPKLTQGKLEELSWSLDVKENPEDY